MARILFWLAFYPHGALVILVSLRSFGSSSPVAILLQCAVVVWATTLVLHLLRRKAAYATAAVWVSTLGLLLGYQVVRRAHYWITIGMEPPDGMGSPMAFLFHFVLEWVLLLPLCFMLAVLIVIRPWRGDQRMDVGTAAEV
ncbi:MAG TPA: hypothetical protein VGR35_16795 [Tepidisphaeraceae bacterium]|nr:hypothetical protein [Tepidisphaeraceae bacterium]